MLNKVKHAGREKSVSCDSGSWFAAVTCLLISQRQLLLGWFAAVMLVWSCNMFADITAAVGLQL